MRNALLRSARTSTFAAANRGVQFYSIKAQAASAAKGQGLDPSKLTITETKNPKALSKPEDLVFGREFTGTSQCANSVTMVYMQLTIF